MNGLNERTTLFADRVLRGVGPETPKVLAVAGS